MTTQIENDVSDTWTALKLDPNNQDLRNILIERYLPLVRYNADRVWAKLPDGVNLKELI